MLTIETIRERLRDARPSRVAEATGLHYNTVRRVRDGDSVQPSYEVIKKLSDYLEGGQNQHG